jgi:hypothetical protein
LDVAVDVGRVEVHLEDVHLDDTHREDMHREDDVHWDDAAPAGAPAPQAPGRRVRVEVRHDPTQTGSWAQRIGEVASWLGSVTSAPISDAETDRAALAADAVRQAQISWAGGSDGEPTRLTVRSGSDLPLRMVPLAVTVWAPAGSRIAARTGAGDVALRGRAGQATVRTGAGTAETADIDGDADVTTGSGGVALGAVGGRIRVRTGSGAVRVRAVGGTTDIKAGSGDVTLGEVGADVAVRTGTGGVQVADARAGRVELTTGSGGLTIGVHAGVLAELDLSSGSGSARSDLQVQGTAPAREPALRLRGRTASGDVLVTRAAAPA